VISFLPIENAPQLITAPGVFVTVSVLPLLLKLAVPETTLPPIGFAKAKGVKHDATASAKALAFNDVGCAFGLTVRTLPRD
jgi:hypothetical protein